MPLHAELHRHLGGAIVPRIFWRFLHRQGHPLAEDFPEYEQFEAFITRPRASLTEFLELHTLVEHVQRVEVIPYFVSKLVRGAYIFESILYLELRHTPYYRTDPESSERERIAQMEEIVVVIAESSRLQEYPILLKQILCMHSRLPLSVNRAIVELAASHPDKVCGIDLGGPDVLYGARLGELVELFRYARSFGLKTTCHLFETESGMEFRFRCTSPTSFRRLRIGASAWRCALLRISRQIRSRISRRCGPSLPAAKRPESTSRYAPTIPACTMYACRSNTRIS